MSAVARTSSLRVLPSRERVTKTILIRGLGPSLAQFHISRTLADPILELHKPGTTVVVNDNWKSTQLITIQATGIPPSNESESAIVATLAPGAILQSFAERMARVELGWSKSTT